MTKKFRPYEIFFLFPFFFSYVQASKAAPVMCRLPLLRLVLTVLVVTCWAFVGVHAGNVYVFLFLWRESGGTGDEERRGRNGVGVLVLNEERWRKNPPEKGKRRE